MDILEINLNIQKFIESESINNEKHIAMLNQVNILLNGKFNLRPGILYKLKCLRETLTLNIKEYENLQFFNIDVSFLIEKYPHFKQTKYGSSFF
jgi:hypothetical protein